MKNYEITEEQIKELAKGNAKVKKMFPEVFETKLETGKWYKYKKFLIYVLDETHWCGYDACENWQNNVYYDNLLKDKDFEPATDSEVEEALTNEAKKRGLKIGVFCEWPHANPIEIKEYLYKDNYLYCDKNFIIMDKYGKWATPIKTYTKEEAEKMLNAKIVC